MARSRRDRDDDDDDDRPAKKSRSRRDDDDDEEPPPRKKPARSRDDDDDEDDRPVKKKPARARDDDDDDDTPPPPKKKPAPVRSRDDDDDDEDDRPVKKKSRARDDDDDDDYEDRPVRRKKSKKKSSGGGASPLLFILLGVGALVVLVGGGLAVFFLFLNDNPKSAYEDIQNAAVAKNYGGVYDRLDTDSQKGLGTFMEFAVLDSKMAAHKSKKGRELFVALCEESDKENTKTGNSDTMFDRWKKKSTVESVENTSDTTATITVRNPEGKIDKVKMVKQEGKWRLNLGLVRSASDDRLGEWGT